MTGQRLLKVIPDLMAPLTPKGRSVHFDGVTYPSMAQASGSLGICHKVLVKRPDQCLIRQVLHKGSKPDPSRAIANETLSIVAANGGKHYRARLRPRSGEIE